MPAGGRSLAVYSVAAANTAVGGADYEEDEADAQAAPSKRVCSFRHLVASLATQPAAEPLAFRFPAEPPSQLGAGRSQLPELDAARLTSSELSDDDDGLSSPPSSQDAASAAGSPALGPPRCRRGGVLNALLRRSHVPELPGLASDGTGSPTLLKTYSVPVLHRVASRQSMLSHPADRRPL